MKNALDKFTEELTRKGFKFEMNIFGSHEIYTVDGQKIPECWREVCTVYFVTYPNPEMYNQNSMERETEFLKLLKRKKTVTPYQMRSIYRGYMYTIATPEDAETLKKDAEHKHFKLEEFWQAEHERRLKEQATA